MMLSSLQLEAFLAVARTLHFTRAARRVGITQSALSQRIANLERDLEVGLLVRDRAGVRLTAAGQALLRHCVAIAALEDELGTALQSDAARLAGPVRVGAYSSIARSVVLPVLARYFAGHAEVTIDLVCDELPGLATYLRTGRVDLVFLDHAPRARGIMCQEIGAEEYVVVEPTRPRPGREAHYLDTSEDDTLTVEFLRRARPGEGVSFSRSLVADIDGILDGVTLGLGRGVVPLHLIGGRRGIRRASGYRAMRVPVVLCHHAQPYESRLLRVAREVLIEGVSATLAAASSPKGSRARR